MGNVWEDSRLKPEVLKRAEGIMSGMESYKGECSSTMHCRYQRQAGQVWQCYAGDRLDCCSHLIQHKERTASNEELVRELSGCGGSVTSAIRADYGDDTWDALKQEGSEHYKTGSVEPIDLYRAAGAFRHFALCSIIKYAFRNIRITGDRYIKDLDKIIDFARKLKAECRDDARRT